MRSRNAAPGAAAVWREAEALQAACRQIDAMIEDQFHSLDERRRTIAELEREEAAGEAEIVRLRGEIVRLEAELAQADLLFAPRYRAQSQFYRQFVESPLTEEARRLIEAIRSGEYRGIVVYPVAVHWEPLQRPQHLLIELARKGYLCFFCAPGNEPRQTEIEKGLYVVSRPEHLLQALQAYHVLVLNTYLMQNSWIDHLPHKTVWYDVLDRVDFFGLYDRNMLAKHYQVLHEAELVTYSAKRLTEYVGDRADAVYMPNAVRPEDFRVDPGAGSETPDDLRPIVAKNKKIIGYYGAIEEWFDAKLVIDMARAAEIEIVLIGHCAIPREPFPDNVHFLGPKPYARLAAYAAYFDALMIPFIVNALTNAVSPVKFFEYCAIGKPILSTPIAEVVPYAGPGIALVRSGEVPVFDDSFWTLSPDAEARLQAIARTHQWRKRADEVERELESRPSCLNVFANRPPDRHVSVFTATFFDYDGENYYTGGAERYLVDLHEVCEELGLRLDLYQYGNYAWYRKYRDIDVYSLGHEALDAGEFSIERLNAFNRRYLHAAEGKSMLHVYSAFFQAYPDAAHPSIGISHGVAWDNRGSAYEDGTQFWRLNERFIQSAERLQRMVSVDTNTANWFQTVSYETGRRMLTIPNYVDPNEFYPVPRKKDGKIRIVYPRRLYEARGLYLVLAVVDRILERYPRTEFHFVGKGFEADVRRIDQAIRRWPDRIFRYHRDPDEMHAVYKEADIVLIPTLYSEGTSLSCLEACATGNAVIATRIGGLTDLIIDRFNGLLVSPNRQSLEEAIVECLDNPQLRRRLGRNALQVAQAFNKASWKERWKKVILESLGSDIDGTGKGTDHRREGEVEIRLGPGAKKEDWLPEAVRLLKEGKAVFIRGAGGRRPETSFGRLQWIADEAELYFQPVTISFD
ncbi:glycosyltransferase [Paenibacillaceae bacterium WGS1546]|uniref:glycosyltransferase n=1 Tax=Cohnella sp. WGS1546 TaxID=3366810 RepID=UPI00372D55B7